MLVLASSLIVGSGAAAAMADRPPCPPLPNPPPITDEERNRAMFSVTAQTMLLQSLRLPEGFAPYSVPLAMALLAADRDRLAPSRLRRAIAKLAAYRLGDPVIDCVLQKLGIDTAALARALAAAPLSRAGRETAAYNFVGGGLQVEGCNAKDLQIHTIDANPAFTITSELWVGRPRDQIAKILDPQSWDVCSKFWRPPQGTFLVNLRSDGSVPSGTPTPGTPETVGLPYSSPPRVLFEHFRCLNDICSIEAYLNVWTYVQNIVQPVAGPAYHVWYNLKLWKSGSFTILGFDLPVELDTDYGLLQAVDDPTQGTRVYMSKTLRFTTNVTTEVAEAATTEYTELAGQLAEMVCCGASL